MTLYGIFENTALHSREMIIGPRTPTCALCENTITELRYCVCFTCEKKFHEPCARQHDKTAVDETAEKLTLARIDVWRGQVKNFMHLVGFFVTEHGLVNQSTYGNSTYATCLRAALLERSASLADKGSSQS